MIPFYENSHVDFRIFRSHNLIFPFHLHTQLELLYVESGHLEITVQDQTLVLKDHDFAIFFPNQIHRYNSNHGENDAIIAICDLTLCGDFLNSLTKYNPVIPFISAEKIHQDVFYALSSLLTESQTEKNKGVYCALIQLILARISPQLTLQKNSHSNTYSLTYEIAQYISQNFTEHLSLDRLASQIGVSKYHISHVFSRKMGTNLNDYLNSFRLNYAVHLIRTTHKSLSEIYNESGFDSQRTFNRVFKNTYEMTPSKFRESSQRYTANLD
ncbi:MAG: AraC family transcriptional regulator [Vallitaleaceae bacterium]|nr:AraC family transcriptional regulator [Vallitaleaceae bacterium]